MAVNRAPRACFAFYKAPAAFRLAAQPIARHHASNRFTSGIQHLGRAAGDHNPLTYIVLACLAHGLLQTDYG
jgi:hypothetical protein